MKKALFTLTLFIAILVGKPFESHATESITMTLMEYQSESSTYVDITDDPQSTMTAGDTQKLRVSCKLYDLSSDDISFDDLVEDSSNESDTERLEITQGETNNTYKYEPYSDYTVKAPDTAGEYQASFFCYDSTDLNPMTYIIWTVTVEEQEETQGNGRMSPSSLESIPTGYNITPPDGAYGTTTSGDTSTKPSPSDLSPSNKDITPYTGSDSTTGGDTGTDTDTDDDSDGFSEDDGDCDDADPSTYPDAEEICDDIDNDCDDETDEEATDITTWYVDSDNDGYGNADSVTQACDQPDGYVSDNTDCNDEDASVNTGATEICDDDVDNNCDGTTDYDIPTWYLDYDNDGYGSETQSIQTCEQPSGYVSDNSDCDDADDTISPAGAEITDDGIDQDCDGSDSASEYFGDPDDPDESGSGAEETDGTSGGGCGCDISGTHQSNSINSIFLILLLVLPVGIMLVLRKKRNSCVPGDDNNLSWDGFVMNILINIRKSFIFFGLIGFLLAGLFSFNARAATIWVTANSDDVLDGSNGVCSLREAIINTNHDKSTYSDCKPMLSGKYGDDTLIIPAGTYCLSIPNSDADATVPTSGTDEELSKTGDLDIRGNLTIRGAGAVNTIIDAGVGSDTDCTASLLDRVIESANSTTVSISDVTITGGNLTATTSSADGGGIYTNSYSTLTLTDSTVSGNTATSNSFDAKGGGIYLSSGATLTNSTVSDNSATNSGYHAYGGGVYVYSGTMIVTNSTLSGNSATTNSSYAKGGGIYVGSGGSTPNIFSSTVSGNSAISSSDKAYGGGIYLYSNMTINIKSTILSNNSAQGSMASYGAECHSGGTWNSYGYNFIADASASTSDNCVLVYTTSLADSSTDITKTHEELLLSELADNDGDTDTHALKSGSPAIDTGSCTDIDGNSMTTDQRGSSRPVDGDGDDTAACDIGAYEYQITCGDGVKAGSEACDDSNSMAWDGCSATCTTETDADGDGYYADNDDCDDTDSSINPGAEEVADDGIDQDCNGEDASVETCLDVY